ARETGVDATTAQYHLRRLAKEGFAVAHPTPGGARWFAAGQMARDERERVLARDVSPGVLAAVRAAPGLAKQDLAQRCGVARATLAWHLARLAKAGLVREAREGRTVRVWATERAPGAPDNC
ncbi:MAG TPA: winged helix-turn-helix transcriptional regulator, partial [Candidatus Thermoplasmatota archaeon]|nr:winged helix-turn-helix transcriptional regulator [Candidatus Thermoplasmatota archaeon]